MDGLENKLREDVILWSCYSNYFLIITDTVVFQLVIPIHDD